MKKKFKVWVIVLSIIVLTTVSIAIGFQLGQKSITDKKIFVIDMPNNQIITLYQGDRTFLWEWKTTSAEITKIEVAQFKGDWQTLYLPTRISVDKGDFIFVIQGNSP